MDCIARYLLYVLSLLSLLALVAHGQDCSLIVPPRPLTAAGLATPYYLVSNDPKNPCNQTANGASFVQGAVIDLLTGTFYVYNPIVIDKGSVPAVAPVLPVLPKNHVVGLWFGTNGDSLTLIDNTGSLDDGQCVNGITGSIFGQFSYCNAPLFFLAANALVAFNQVNIPRLGTALDKQPCPTTRSFFIVDQDQSDNVVTSYLITPSGKIAQNTAANRKSFPTATVLDNGSDEGLVVAVNKALGCTSWQVQDLADPGGNALASLPLNELLAAYRGGSPIALVPAGDPMVLNTDGTFSLSKLNAYRLGVDQVPVSSLNQADTGAYCKHLAHVFPTRMALNVTRKLLSAQASPDPDVGNNLFTFLAARFIASYANLNCQVLLKQGPPVVATVVDKTDGCVMDAEVDVQLIPADSEADDNSAAISLSVPHVSLFVILVSVLWTM